MNRAEDAKWLEAWDIFPELTRYRPTAQAPVAAESPASLFERLAFAMTGQGVLAKHGRIIEHEGAAR